MIGSQKNVTRPHPTSVDKVHEISIPDTPSFANYGRIDTDLLSFYETFKVAILFSLIVIICRWIGAYYSVLQICSIPLCFRSGTKIVEMLYESCQISGTLIVWFISLFRYLASGLETEQCANWQFNERRNLAVYMNENNAVPGIALAVGNEIHQYFKKKLAHRCSNFVRLPQILRWYWENIADLLRVLFRICYNVSRYGITSHKLGMKKWYKFGDFVPRVFYGPF